MISLKSNNWCSKALGFHSSSTPASDESNIPVASRMCLITFHAITVIHRILLEMMNLLLMYMFFLLIHPTNALFKPQFKCLLLHEEFHSAHM